jgi:hypothetical protein
VTESTDDEVNNTPGDPEDKTFRSRMTSKGIFKSRNIQRPQEELKKKRKGAHSEIIDLAKEKQIKATECHSIAAKTHAEGVKCQSQIAAIEQALKMGISADVLRPSFMAKTLHTLFNSTPSSKDYDNVDDSNEVQFVSSAMCKSKCKTVEPEEPVLTLPSSFAIASIHHGKTATGTSGKNGLRGKCCVEDECVFATVG